MNATDKSIALTILEQLGGNKFIAMTGAKNLIATENGLTFRLPGKNFAKNSINIIQITLDPSDTYTITFSRLWGTKMKTIVEIKDVYNDNLQRVFKIHTGLDTHL